MAINLNDNIKILAPKPSDSRYFTSNNAPWATVADANAGIPLTERHIGLVVNINKVLYWYESGINNENLVVQAQVVDISGKVDKVTGKSLVLDTEIAKLANLTNVDISTKVDKVLNKSLVLDTEIAKLVNLDNTKDSDKAISTATKNALDLKAPLASPAFTGTVTGISKSMVGLGNVDNTTDAGKPISTATQTALDARALIASPIFTGTVTGISKSMVGLGNVDNTTDAGKPISTATQTALNLKASIASPIFTGTVTGISKSMVGLDSVDNTTDVAKPISTLAQTALNLKASIASPIFTGTVTGISKSMVGLDSVDNTTDALKPISTATQTALDAKASKESPIFTGTVTGISKSMVGLGNVDNTTDAGKPISTATQTALNLKENTIDRTNDIEANKTSTTKIPTAKAVDTFWTYLKTQIFLLGTLAGIGNRIVQVDSTGTLSASFLIQDGFTSDIDVITALTSATYNVTNTYTATLIPANAKVFSQGQWYKNGGVIYFATADNQASRITLS